MYNVESVVFNLNEIVPAGAGTYGVCDRTKKSSKFVKDEQNC